jgi:type IV pilus assembly protein PilY1
VIDANTFTYTLASAATGTAAGTLMLASLPVKYITHGSNSDTATVTLYSSHAWSSGLNIIIQGTGGAAITGYDAPFGSLSGSPWGITNVNQAAGTFDITYSATGGNRLRNAPACLKGSSADANPSGFASCTVRSGMTAGRQITALVPVIQATGTIYAAKNINVDGTGAPLIGLSALTTAVGAISAGRTQDSSTTVRDQIIAWVRGADNKENEDPATDSLTPGPDIRPSAHGDVLHSRPAVVNYNRYGDDEDIYAFYGSNDGIFHALKGGLLNHTTGPDTAINPGSERWGFIPREFFGQLKRLREQSPTISNITQKDYFADGSIGVYQKDAKGNGSVASPLNCVPGSCSGADTVSGVLGDNVHPTAGDKVHIYMTMRRGGAFMYALDVTNPSTPKLLWRKSASDSGWEQLGMSWSEPRIARVRADLSNLNNPENVVLIFGAGYDDTVEDINPCLLDSSSTSAVVQKAVGSGTVTYTASGSCTVTSASGSATTFSRTKGRAILVVDAFDGTVVFQASAGVTTGTTSDASSRTLKKLNVPGMTCALPSDTTVLDKNRDGFADRVYVGDTCGQVWRLDISDASMDEWTATTIARLSSSTDTDVANKRKFLFPPDLVFGTDGTGNYTAVLLGSGDREHPFDTTVVNRFYMLKDRDSSAAGNLSGATNSTSVKMSGFSTSPTGSPLTDADVFDASNAALVSGTDPLGLNGWKIILGGGEKVISSATSVAGTVFFNTNQPSSTAGGGACGSNLGIAREYLVGFADAAATTDLNGVGGVTISDRSTIHEGGGYLPSPVPVVVEIDGKRYQAVISGTSVQTPPGLTLEKRTRQYWYRQID